MAHKLFGGNCSLFGALIRLAFRARAWAISGIGLSLSCSIASAQPLHGETPPCRHWKAVLPNLSPLGLRIELPDGWGDKGDYRRFSINADGIVTGSAELVPVPGAARTEVAWAWSPRPITGYALSTGVTRLPGLYETPEDPTTSAACDVSDNGFAVGQSRETAVRWDLAQVGTPVSAFTISPAPVDTSAALGIDRVGGVVVAGVTTETCNASGPGANGPQERAFVGDAIALSADMLVNELWIGMTSIYRGKVFGFACDSSSICGGARTEIAQSCGPILFSSCQFETSRTFRWFGAPIFQSRVVVTLGSTQVGSEGIRARDADTLVGRSLDPSDPSSCAPRALIWRDLTSATPSSEDLQAYVTLPSTADSSVAIGIRRNRDGEVRVAGATAVANAPGVVATYSSAVVWDNCQSGWQAEHPLVPTLVHDLDPARTALWRPICDEWHALVAYDTTNSGLFVGSTSSPSNRVFVATRMTDINADLIVDATDVSAILGAWGTTTPSDCLPLAEDTNIDLVVDAADFALVLSDWTLGVITELESFCCQSAPVTISDLELALALSGEGDIDTFRAVALRLDRIELSGRCAIIHETLEVLRHGTQ